ncbi:MAG TPA: sialidase family protein [Acidimicrobiales bacterium]|nr:sialidase family protein [Acidimicrobiales bacterium]
MRRSLLLLLVPFVLVASPVGAQTATGAVQVTNDPAPLRSHSSPQIAVNPKTGELVVVESDVRGNRACAVHLSTDGGRSWFPGGDPMTKPFNDCGFYAEYGPLATMAFAQDGTLYMAFVASDFLNRIRNATPRHVFLARSSDSGRTFTTARVFEAPDGNQDRGLNKGPMLAVDPNNPERVYVGWRQGVFAADAKEKLKSVVSTSLDGGRTFSPPFDLSDERGADFPALAVDKDGTVHAVYWVRTGLPANPVPPRPILYRRSVDQGRTWSDAVEVDPGNVGASHPPLLAADPETQDVYMVWNANEEVQNMVQGFNGDLDVFLRVSHDAGRTWSDRIVLSDETVKANQYEPGIAISPNGTVHVAWYDFRHSPTPMLVSTGHSGDTGISDVYYTSSNDHGSTWARPVRVNDRGIDRSKGVWSNNIDSKFNVGVAATDKAVHFAWQDTRNALGETGSEDIYTSSVPLAPETTSSGDSGIPGWTLIFTGLFGLGLGVTVAWVLMRRRGDAAPAPLSPRTPARV